MRESARIIGQAVENIPTGPVNVDVEDKLTIPDKAATYRSIEGLIQHFELFMWNRRWKPPVDEVYGATEAPDGELGFYIVSDGEGRPWRARTRPPSFIHFALFPLLMEGHVISDVPAVLGSLDIIAPELDRGVRVHGRVVGRSERPDQGLHPPVPEQAGNDAAGPAPCPRRAALCAHGGRPRDR